MKRSPFIFLLITLAASAVTAQPSQESDLQTYSRALAEIRSSKAEERHRGLLLLGSYLQYEAALLASMSLLNDTNDKVRLAAVINVSKIRPFPHHYIDEKYCQKVLFLLQDKNIQIRRLSASNLMRPILYSQAMDQIPAAKSTLAQLCSSSDSYLNQAVIKNFRLLQSLIPDLSAAEVFQKADDKNLLLASNSLLRFLKTKEQLSLAAQKVASEGSTATRYAFLSNILQRRYSKVPLTPAVKKFSQDKDSNILTLTFFALGLKEETTLTISNYLQKKIITEKTLRLSFSLNHPKENEQKLLKLCLLHNHPEYRLIACDFFKRYQINISAEDILTLLKDPRKNLRRRCLALTSQSPQLSSKHIPSLIAMENPEAVLTAGRLMKELKDCGQDSEYLMEMLVHDNDDVREKALSLLLDLKHPQHLLLLERALSDDSSSVRKAAKKLLSRAKK